MVTLKQDGSPLPEGMTQDYVDAIKHALKRGLDANQIEAVMKAYHYGGYGSVDEALGLLSNSSKVEGLNVALANIPGDAQGAWRDFFEAYRTGSPEVIQRYLSRATGVEADDYAGFVKGLERKKVSEASPLYEASASKPVSPETWDNQILPAILRFDGGPKAIREAAGEVASGQHPGSLEAASELHRLADQVEAIHKQAADVGFAGGLLPSGHIAELSQQVGSAVARPKQVSTRALIELDKFLGGRAKSISKDRPELAGKYRNTSAEIRGTGRTSGLDPETGYNEGRAVSRSYKTAIQAAESGSKAFANGKSLRTLVDDIKLQIDGEMDDLGKAALLMGWMRSAEDAIESSGGSAQVINRLYGSANQRKKMLAMIPTAKSKGLPGAQGDQTKRINALGGGKITSGGEKLDLPSIFDRQRKVLNAEKRMTGGSPTAGKAAAVFGESEVTRFIDGVFDVVLNPVGSAKTLTRKVTHAIAKPPVYKEGINRELGNIMTTTGKQGIEKRLADIRKVQGMNAPRGGRAPNALAPKGPVRGAGFTGKRPTPKNDGGTMTAKGVKYTAKPTTVNDSYQGEIFAYKELVGQDGRPIAAADINILGGEISIRDIVTRADSKRQGLATSLVEEIQAEYPGKTITLTGTTDDGEKFFGASFDIGKNGEVRPKNPVRGAGWTGTRPRGFNDDLERGTDAFSDPRLNADQNKIAEMAKNGYSNAEIGEEMGKLPQTVAVRISQLRRKGIDIPAGRAIRPVTPERVQMEKLINEGLSNAQIAKRTGKSSAHVGVIRNRLKTTGPAHAGFEGAKSDLASGAVGSSYGYTQGDTPEEKNANAAMGFVSGIAAKRAGGAVVRRGSAMTNALAPKGPVRGAGFSGNTPKPGSGRLGRGLNDLLNEPGPARPARPDDLPRRTVEPPAQGRPDPTLSRERTSKDDKAFYDSLSAPERDHARAVGPIGKMGKEPPPPGFVVTASLLTALGGAGGVSAYLGSRPVEPNFAQNRSRVMSELAKAPDSATWQNRARQFDAFVKSDTARQTDLEGVDKRLLNARRKAVREASDAFATAGDRAELTAAIDRVEALDYAIDVSLGNAEPFDEAPPMARPPSLKPVPNALAGPPPMTRNSQGQFVRPMTNRERQEAAR